jgi:uncharacterized protein (DUF924 family)
MQKMAQDEIDEVLEFWLGELDELGRADAAQASRWFTKDQALDEEMRRRFRALHRAVAVGDRDAWLGSPRGRLAYVIVLDQFSRNMFRGTPEMFATDDKARAAAVAGLDAGLDRELGVAERMFLYMPLMHSEALADQERCVALFSAFLDEAPAAAKDEIANALKFAKAHRDIVARFGRFPHRNATLGRQSTDEELAFLAQPGSSF